MRNTDVAKKEIPKQFVTDMGEYVLTKLQVCSSAAGYYIGRMSWDKEGEFEETGSRESGYFKTKEDASLAMRRGFELRDCNENDYAYTKGMPAPVSKSRMH